MWIETGSPVRRQNRALNSFASNGECGLKRHHRQKTWARPMNSFASNGECGLKHAQAWSGRCGMWQNSFASNGECGLKLAVDDASLFGDGQQFIRQQWRMWIETSVPWPTCSAKENSFASNGECGLKQCRSWLGRWSGQGIHSPAMANVD